jgi:hypothetical protein
MSQAASILYAGDTSLDSAAIYLAGLCHHARMHFDYVASDQPLPAKCEYGLYVISDYPVNHWSTEQFDALAEQVHAGAGLVMIGGWESFHGLAGEYHESPLAELLPVTMHGHDDREQSRRPWVLQPLCDHPITAGLPWEHPPTVGGFNRLIVRPDATEVLAAHALEIDAADGQLRLTVGATEPMLVVGTYGRGRVAALACDVAPHWVGTFVDWGTPRITAAAAGAGEIEVGCHYAAFFINLLQWAMNDI